MGFNRNSRLALWTLRRRDLTTYTCKQCGKAIERRADGEFVRNCDCKDAAIVAHMKATAYGEAKVAQGKAL